MRGRLPVEVVRQLKRSLTLVALPSHTLVNGQLRATQHVDEQGYWTEIAFYSDGTLQEGWYGWRMANGPSGIRWPATVAGMRKGTQNIQDEFRVGGLPVAWELFFCRGRHDGFRPRIELSEPLADVRVRAHLTVRYRGRVVGQRGARMTQGRTITFGPIAGVPSGAEAAGELVFEGAARGQVVSRRAFSVRLRDGDDNCTCIRFVLALR
jgi:hypothetical protein